ncbi:MAG: glycine cleavage system protein GcvH [Planctomycetota bacterium]
MTRNDLLYSKTHEWLRVEADAQGGKIGVVGITDFAVKLLTDLVFIDLPKPGRQVKAGEPFGEVESVKAVSDLYSPVDGEVIEVNGDITEKLDTINADPFGAGWLIKVRIADPSQVGKLLSLADYEKQCAEEQH